MEDTRTFKIVGGYSVTQADIHDCVRCHDAKYATILIDGLCLDCHEKKVIEKDIIERFVFMAVESIDPDAFDKLEDVLEQLTKNRHISYDLKKSLDKKKPPKIVIWKDGTYKYVRNGITWEYEADEDWLATIDVLLLNKN